LRHAPAVAGRARRRYAVLIGMGRQGQLQALASLARLREWITQAE